MPGTVFISRQLPQEALDLARARAEVRANLEDRRLGKAELAARLADAEGRRLHAVELINILDKHFLTRPRAEWEEILSRDRRA